MSFFILYTFPGNEIRFDRLLIKSYIVNELSKVYILNI